MKAQFKRCNPSQSAVQLVLALSAAALAGTVLAGDMPKRKAGLWEITMQSNGMPGMGPIEQCIDQNSDNLMQQQAKQHKTDCSVMDIKPQGNKVTIHSVCKFDGSTATTRSARPISSSVNLPVPAPRSTVVLSAL